MDENEILPDVPKILDFLKKEGFPIALGSASKNARTILQKVNLYDLFDAIVDGTNVSKAKPDPEVFLKGAELLRSQPSNCIVFEDSISGIHAANTAGMISIGLGDSVTLGHADHVFTSFEEIPSDFIQQLIDS